MEIVNLTPHDITEVDTGRVFPRSGYVARVQEERKLYGTVQGIQIYTNTCGSVEGIPEGFPSDTIFIVSKMVKDAVNGMENPPKYTFISPGSLVRDDKGMPVGCKGFAI